MAAIQTTLTLKDDVSKRLIIIEKRVKSLGKTMKNFNKSVVETDKKLTALSAKAEKVSKSMKKLGDTAKDIDKVNRSLKQTRVNSFSAKSGVDGLTQSIKRLAAAYLGMVGVGKILDTADVITGATNKLSTVYRMENPNATGAETQVAVQGQMDDIFASAQRSRSDYNATMQNVGKMLINAGDTFEGNLDKAIAFNELMSKSYTIGGAHHKEQESSMYQLIQALGSGTLAGDELRSVREGAQVAYKYIEEYAQELLNSEESLKDLASKGLITSDIVTDAILKNAEAINSMFDDTQVSFEQTWAMMKNNFVKAFEPVLQQLTTVLNNEDFQNMLTGLTSAFVSMANVVLNGLEWISEKWNQVNGFLQKNADIISQLVIPILGALAIAWVGYGIAAFVASIIANWQLLLIIATIVAVIGAVIWLTSEFEWFGQFVGGLIGGLISTIWNGIVGLVNGIYGIVITVYNFIANIVNTFANMFGNGFSGFLISVTKLFWNFVEVVIDGLQAVARVMDAVFGTGIHDALGNFQNKVNDFISENDGFEEKIIIEKLDDKELLKPVNMEEWVDKGINIGGTIHEKLSGVQDWLGGALATGNDPFGGNDWDTTIKNALDGSGTGEDIGNIADSIELTKEDLEFLRELAEMETINRFTTAEIKVDMSNYNTINGENDLDGLVVKLSEKIEEEMHIVAEGTY